MSELAVAAMDKAQARIYAAIHDAERELREVDPRYALNLDIDADRIRMIGGPTQANWQVTVSATLNNRSLRS